MDNKFKLLQKSQMTFAYLNKLLPNISKKDSNLKRHIEDTQYTIIKYVLSYDIQLTNNMKRKKMDKMLAELSFYDYLTSELYHKKYLSKHQIETLSNMISEVRKISYNIIKSLGE